METIGKYPTQLLFDVVQCALESWSCQFWAQVYRYRWYWWHQTDESGEPIDDTINPEIGPDTVLLKVRDASEDREVEHLCNKENCESWVDITPQKIADATDWALENYNHLFNWHVSHGKIDEIDYDVIGADVILQKIVLGDVVYG